MNFIINIPEKYLSIEKNFYEMIADMAKDGVNGKVKLLSDDATNGDVIKTMFPDVSICEGREYGYVYSDGITLMTYDIEWWNTPYNNVEREG